MKGFIAATVVIVAIAVPTMIGYIPAFIGVPAMILVILMKDVIFLWLARGLPMAIMMTRILGGLLWGIAGRKRIDIDRFVPEKGTIQTKKSGSYNIMPDRLFNVGGVQLGLAPENIGYNSGLDHVQLINELKNRGINDIRDITDTNEYGQVVGIKDDERIKDIREKLTVTLVPSKTQIDLSGFDDFYRYTAEAANPYHHEARVTIAKAQGMLGGEKSSALKWIAAIAVIGAVCLAVLVVLTRGGAQEVKVIIENGGHVIPA